MACNSPVVPFVAGQLTELLPSALEGYPYPLKAWITNMTNPLYGVPGLRGVIEESLIDPLRLPLFIAIDAFMNETTALADYIIPDTHNFESWGFSAPWGSGKQNVCALASRLLYDGQNCARRSGVDGSILYCCGKAYGTPGLWGRCNT